MGKVLAFRKITRELKSPEPTEVNPMYHLELRVGIRIARYKHTCSYCGDIIHPKELYKFNIVVRSTKKLKRELKEYRFHYPYCLNDPHAKYQENNNVEQLEVYRKAA